MARSFGAGGGNAKPVDAGVHRAVCYMFAYVGVQPGSIQFPTPQPTVILGWQLPDQLDDNGEPRRVTSKFRASMHKKANLRKTVEGWFGKAFPSEEAATSFDVTKLVGRGCLLNLQHREKGDKVYANVAGVMPLMAGQEAPKIAGLPIIYDVDDPATADAFGALPEWIQKLVSARVVDQQGPAEPGAPAPDGDDDIPF